MVVALTNQAVMEPSVAHALNMSILGHWLWQTVLPEELESQKKKIIDKLVEEDLDVGKATCSTGTGQGFVRENITYMVTDNLEVMPSTTIRSIQVLNQLKVATLADLDTTDISVGITQVNFYLWLHVFCSSSEVGNFPSSLAYVLFGFAVTC
jgi:hypothetical protein